MFKQEIIAKRLDITIDKCKYVYQHTRHMLIIIIIITKRVNEAELVVHRRQLLRIVDLHQVNT